MIKKEDFAGEMVHKGVKKLRGIFWSSKPN